MADAPLLLIGKPHQARELLAPETIKATSMRFRITSQSSWRGTRWSD